MHKRITVVFCLITLLMTTLIYRVYFIYTADYITASAQGQYTLSVASSRGTIYDRTLHGLVNNQVAYVASVMPTPQAVDALLTITPEESKDALLSRLSAGKPFRLEVPDNNIYAQGIDVFRTPLRYGAPQLAPHLIGYLNGDGKNGVAGVEKAYDDWLQKSGSKIEVSYQVDAAGHLMSGAALQVKRTNEDARGGVVLTLDQDMQQLTQTALQSGCEKGAAVVMDIYTGDILGMASIPVFDQNNISAALDSTDAPFINRAISGYNIGSVFKIIASAAALENNITEHREYECKGYIDINGQIFRCNNNAVHGVVDMQRALEVSCNAYFISLAEEMGPDYLLALAQHMGIGTQSELAPGMSTQTGNLPTQAELANPIALANFGFGQGSSLATPLQMAQAISTVANSGMAVTPRLILGMTEDGVNIINRTPSYTSNQIISESTSKTLQNLMIDVIEEGSGRTAKPLQGGAGGKTSSAQTGHYVDDKEIVHAWFAGFYPAKQPKYSIVVFVEGGESGEHVAAPIFKQIANGIYALKK